MKLTVLLQKSGEKNLQFQFGPLRFIDSSNTYKESLGSLIDELKQGHGEHLDRAFPLIAARHPELQKEKLTEERRRRLHSLFGDVDTECMGPVRGTTSSTRSGPGTFCCASFACRSTSSAALRIGSAPPSGSSMSTTPSWRASAATTRSTADGVGHGVGHVPPVPRLLPSHGLGAGRRDGGVPRRVLRPLRPGPAAVRHPSQRRVGCHEAGVLERREPPSGTHHRPEGASWAG